MQGTAVVQETVKSGFGDIALTFAGELASSFIPSIDVPLGDWSISFSPVILTGKGIGAGAAVGISYTSGNFNFSYGFGITNFVKHYATGNSGTEIRNSFMAGFDDGKTGFSLGTNFWSGMKGIDGESLNQRTGILKLRSGDFGIYYENDGAPFYHTSKKSGKTYGLSGGSDKYRTAALGIGIGDFSINSNIFTGMSGQDESGLPFSKAIKDPKLVDFTKGRGHGMWINKTADRYRLGSLTIGYKGMNIGVNSEHVRDFIQNWFAHTKIPGSNQPGFTMLSRDWKLYSIYKTQNQFTLW